MWRTVEKNSYTISWFSSSRLYGNYFTATTLLNCKKFSYKTKINIENEKTNQYKQKEPHGNVSDVTEINKRKIAEKTFFQKNM